MRKIKRSSVDTAAAIPCIPRSSAVECARSNVFPMYPGWPPAELPPREYGLRHVGQPRQASRDAEDER